MISFHQPTAAAVEIRAGDRFLAAIRPVPELQALQAWLRDPPAGVRAADAEAYLLGWIRGAAANQGRGDLVVGLGLGPLRYPNSGAACPPRRSEATAAGGIPAPGCADAGVSGVGTGVSSQDSTASRSDAAKTPDTGGRGAAGRRFLRGEKVRYLPFDLDGTVTGAGPDGVTIAVTADACGSPMLCHPDDLVGVAVDYLLGQ